MRKYRQPKSKYVQKSGYIQKFWHHNFTASIFHIQSHRSHSSHLATRKRRQLTLSTSASRVRVDLSTASTALVNTLILLADLLCRSARSANGGCVTEVGVDADEIGGKPESADILDDDLAGRLFGVVGAVAAGAVEFARVDDGVVFDGYCACAAGVGVSMCLGLGLGLGLGVCG